MIRTLVTLSVATAGALALGIAPASAASVNTTPPGWLTAPGGSQSHGLGFCWSQVAQHPEYVGASHLGALAHEIAQSGPGAMATMHDEARYPVCGGPGSGE